MSGTITKKDWYQVLKTFGPWVTVAFILSRKPTFLEFLKSRELL